MGRRNDKCCCPCGWGINGNCDVGLHCKVEGYAWLDMDSDHRNREFSYIGIIRDSSSNCDCHTVMCSTFLWGQKAKSKGRKLDDILVHIFSLFHSWNSWIWGWSFFYSSYRERSCRSL